MFGENTVVMICGGIPFILILLFFGIPIILDARHGFQLRDRRKLISEQMGKGEFLSEIIRIVNEKGFRTPRGQKFTIWDLRKEFSEELSDRYRSQIPRRTEIRINGDYDSNAPVAEYEGAFLEIRGQAVANDLRKVRNGEIKVLSISGAGTKFTMILCRFNAELEDVPSLFTSRQVVVCGLGELAVPGEKAFSGARERWLVVSHCNIVAYD